jgi:hypothetical protein
MIITGEDIDSDLMEEVRKRLQDRNEAELALAKAEQLKLAEFHRNIESATVEGIGQHIMRVTPESYHYWGNRLGYECWGDRGFRKEFLRDNPEARVKYTARKQTILRP